MLGPLNPLTVTSLFSFKELFSFIENKGRANSRGRRVPHVAIRDLLSVVERAVAEVCSKAALLQASPPDSLSSPLGDFCPVHYGLVITLHLGCLLCRLMPSLTDKQRHQAHQTLYSLVSQNIRVRFGQTPLHLACSSISTIVGRLQACRFPSLELVEMLLDVGADPNARDYLGNTPLHLAASNQPCPPALVRVLLSHGAHLDARNATGQTFRDLLGGKDEKPIINPLHYTKLSCLAARVIRDNNIPFSHGQIPASLEEFVLQH